MELRQLEHFVAVAEEGSFTRAARRVNIVQSGLSASIRALERELAAALFVRRPREVVLSTEGEAFLPEARRALGAVRSGIDSVSAVRGLLRGRLVLGASAVLPPPLDLPSLLQRFHGDHPAIRIRLRQEPTKPLLDDLAAGSLDLVIAGRLPKPDPELGFTLLRTFPMQLVCSTASPLAKRRTVTLAEIAAEPFIDITTDWTSRQLIDAAFAQAGLSRDVCFELSDPGCLLALVQRGLGVAIVPVMRSQRKSRVAYVSLRPALPRWELVAAYCGAQPSGVAARAFLALARRAAAEGAATGPVHPPSSARQRRVRA